MKHIFQLICVVLIFFPLKTQSQVPDIYINEFLASNATVIADPDFNEYSDWIEIYNNGDSSVNIRGYFLSDNYNDPARWKIYKDIIIGAKEYLIIWCDSKDTIIQALHTNFNLSRSGEEIGFYAADMSIVDTVLFTGQSTNISSGRNPDHLSSWQLYYEPTPGSVNNDSAYIVVDAPVASLEEGFYESDQKLYILSKGEPAIVRYTLDGTDPTEESEIFPDTLFLTDRTSEPNVYSEIRTNRDPFDWLPDWVPPSGNVFKANVVKLRSFEDGKTPSEIITKTYFIKEGMKTRYSLPVISVVANPDDLFDYEDGIYVPGADHINGNSNTGNYFRDSEKKVHISYFEPDGTIGFSQNAGIRIQGGTSPASPQKAFHVIARSVYGNNRIEYPIFKETAGHAKDISEYKRFIIRAWGSTILSAMFNDACAHRIMEKSDLDLQSYQPAILFINGEYWGIHELREANKSDWYFEVHHGVDNNNTGIDLLYHWDNRTQHVPQVNEGDAVHWNSFTGYIHSNDLSTSECYNYVQTQLDIDNFIDYMVHSIYLAKWDWPGNNDATWRPRTSDGKWRYITYDMETGFGVATGLDNSLAFLGPQYNMFNHVLTGKFIPLFTYYGPHLVFKELVKNHIFVQAFVNNMEQKIHNEFSSDTTTSILDDMMNQIEPYMQEHWDRWPYVAGTLNTDWAGSISGIRDFMERRPGYLETHLEEFKSEYLSGYKEINNPDSFDEFIQFVSDIP
ncbi:MAG: CotH kinase family protein, partial [Bacteroidales bacterium]